MVIQGYILYCKKNLKISEPNMDIDLWIISGTDGMGSSFVKNLVRGIEMPLVLLFQRSLVTGQVPEQWKEPCACVQW